MSSENILEKGIVLKASEGHAEVALIENGGCKECSAKIFCKPSGKDSSKVLEVLDPYGVHPGDEVQIEVSGSAVLKASMILYGIPLLLILIGIMVGMPLFGDTGYPELYSFLFGLGLTVLYISGLFFFKNLKKSEPDLPKITFVKRPL